MCWFVDLPYLLKKRCQAQKKSIINRKSVYYKKKRNNYLFHYRTGKPFGLGTKKSPSRILTGIYEFH